MQSTTRVPGEALVTCASITSRPASLFMDDHLSCRWSGLATSMPNSGCMAAVSVGGCRRTGWFFAASICARRTLLPSSL